MYTNSDYCDNHDNALINIVFNYCNSLRYNIKKNNEYTKCTQYFVVENAIEQYFLRYSLSHSH